MLEAGGLGSVPAGFNDPDNLDTNKLNFGEQDQEQPPVSIAMVKGFLDWAGAISQQLLANMIDGGRGWLAAPKFGEPVDSAGDQASDASGTEESSNGGVSVGSGGKRKALEILEEELGNSAVKGIGTKDIPPRVVRRLLAGTMDAKKALELIEKSMDKKEEAKESDKEDKQSNGAGNDAADPGPHSLTVTKAIDDASTNYNSNLA